MLCLWSSWFGLGSASGSGQPEWLMHFVVNLTQWRTNKAKAHDTNFQSPKSFKTSKLKLLNISMWLDLRYSYSHSGNQPAHLPSLPTGWLAEPRRRRSDHIPPPPHPAGLRMNSNVRRSREVPGVDSAPKNKKNKVNTAHVPRIIYNSWNHLNKNTRNLIIKWIIGKFLKNIWLIKTNKSNWEVTVNWLAKSKMQDFRFRLWKNNLNSI